MDLVQAVLGGDAPAAAAALERLCQVAGEDGVLLAALGTHPSLLPRLRDLLEQPPAGEGASAANTLAAEERMRMGAAFLVSQLAGKAAAIDRRMFDLRIIPALVAAAAAPAGGQREGWGRRRGALRAIAKLLAAQPALAAAQLAGSGGVAEVARLLDPEDADQLLPCAGVAARRALSILRFVADVAPGGPAGAGLLAPPLPRMLVRLLAGRYRGSGSEGEVEREAAALLLRLARAPGAAPVLAAAGAGPVLSSAAFCSSPEASQLAEEALRVLRSQPGWQVDAEAGEAPIQTPAAASRLAPQRPAGSEGALQTPAGGPRPAWQHQQSPLRAASHPPPRAGQRGQGGTRGSGHPGPTSATQGSNPRVQQRQAQQQLTEGGGAVVTPACRPPTSSSALSPAGSGASSSSSGGGHPSAAELVAALRCGFLRTQLAAAEQLAAVAASGTRAAQIVAAAGAAAALAECVAETAAGPVTVQDTLQDAYAAALQEALCTAALRALCTLCQALPSAAAALYPSAPTLRLLLRAPDPQQRQLAAMLLAAAQGVPQAGPPPMRTSAALLQQPGAQPQGPQPSHELLPSNSFSYLSELELGSGQPQHEATPSTVLHPRASSSDGSSARASLTSEPRQPGSARSSQAGAALCSLAESGAQLAALAALAPKARRQLGRLLRDSPSPASGTPRETFCTGDLPTSPRAHLAGLGRSRSTADTASMAQELWGTASLASSPQQSPSGEGTADAASLTHQERAAGMPGGGLLLQRGDIVICQDASGRDVKLGEGGSGVVLKGLMHGVDEVAVKCVKAQTPSESELAAFRREVDLLSSLHHRNIVQYYGVCLEPGSLFFVTELMKGGDLYTALRRHPAALAWERLGRRVALDVALGLNYLHSRRPPMSHRDLKSPNVLLSEEGVAKIGDVGMVRPHVADLVTAQPLMTPLWAAPEVLRRERAGVKADIWSYGLLVLELVSGADIAERQPLAVTLTLQAAAGGGGAAQQPAVPHTDGGAPLVRLPKGAPPVATRIFRSCTQLDPALRPTAAQVVEWLREV